MKKIRYLLEAFVLFLVMMLSKILGAKNASNFGGWIGRTIGPKLAASRKAERNIRKIMPSKTEAEVREIIAGMWDNLGRLMMEYPHIKTIEQNFTTTIGTEFLPDDKKCIFFTGHFGNWEVMPPYFYTHFGFPTIPIYRAPNNPYSDALLKKFRSYHGQLETIPKSTSGMRQMVQALKDGKSLGLLIDQKYNQGIEIDFLGQPAMTSPIYAQLAKKFDIPLIPIRITREDGCSFSIEISQAIETQNRTIEEIVLESHEHLKDWIFNKPEQWLWLHRRWKF